MTIITGEKTESLQSPSSIFSVSALTLKVEVIHQTHFWLVFVSLLINCGYNKMFSEKITDTDVECTAVSLHHGLPSVLLSFSLLPCLLFNLGEKLHYAFSGFHSYLSTNLLWNTVNFKDYVCFSLSVAFAFFPQPYRNYSTCPFWLLYRYADPDQSGIHKPSHDLFAFGLLSSAESSWRPNFLSWFQHALKCEFFAFVCLTSGQFRQFLILLFSRLRWCVDFGSFQHWQEVVMAVVNLLYILHG